MEKPKILIIDDDLDLVEVLKITLTAAQYTVITASNKTDGMEKIISEKPALIVLDVMMTTWQDGFELSRELKNNPEFKNIPILMLTSISERTGVDFKLSAGDPTWMPVDGFLEKPVESAVLLSEVEKLLREKL
ncbi:PleD family two-component system response regulator [Planctomycetota bacterium]